jgi:hypothetical protein
MSALIYACVEKKRNVINSEPKFKKQFRIAYLTTCCLEYSKFMCVTVLYQTSPKLSRSEPQQLVSYV